jgi:RNA polymerase sigma-70 factor (ECF subfamily)
LDTPTAASQRTGADQNRWFSEEVFVHDGKLKSYIRGAFPSIRQEVDDVVQESYLRVWRRNAAKPIRSVKAFLFKATRHVAIDLLREKSRMSLESLSDLHEIHVLDDAPNAADALTVREKLSFLADAVAALPPRCYEVILLRKFEGLSQKEAADRLGISERTVESHTRLALQHCDKYLRRHGVDRLNG